MPTRATTTTRNDALKVSTRMKMANSTISMMNISLRPYRSARPPSAVAPIRIPNREAAATTPFSVAPNANSRPIRGKATPVVKTTMPSKNLPAAASPQMSHCMLVIG
jgi:hypothetical protein